MMPAARFTPTAHARSREVEGELMLVNMTSGNYYVLDDVSGFLWRQLEQNPASADELEAQLLAEYETTPAECRENIENFCRYMLAEQLVESASL
jgi:hypothetical protein